MREHGDGAAREGDDLRRARVRLEAGAVRRHQQPLGLELTPDVADVDVAEVLADGDGDEADGVATAVMPLPPSMSSTS